MGLYTELYGMLIDDLPYRTKFQRTKLSKFPSVENFVRRKILFVENVVRRIFLSVEIWSNSLHSMIFVLMVLLMVLTLLYICSQS